MDRRTIIARVLFLLYLAAIAYMLFSALSNFPEFQKRFLGFETDKIVHFALFFPYPVLLYFAIGKQVRSGWKTVIFILLIFLSGCVLAAGTELIQGLTKYRSAEITDFRADALSLAISSIIALILNLAHKK